MFDQVFMTGFKVFGGHEVNPTQLVAEHFSQAKVPGLTCTVVEVTAKDADAYVQKVKPLIVGCKDQKILNLHFGVGPNHVYQIQKFCYNNKDFGIPDNIGYQPCKEQICEHECLDHPIHTKIDVKKLAHELSKEFSVKESIDPGRYLCNYIYFKSSHDLSVQNQHCCSLFIHFPVLQLSSHNQNVKFVEKLLQILLKKPNKA